MAWRCAAQLRQQQWGAKLFIVALTGWGQESDRRRTKEAGFDHHLIKPVEMSVLTQLLSSHPGDPP